VTLDLDDDLVEKAREHLLAAGYPQVEVVCADGAFGDPVGGVYDRIILTVGAWDILPAWREQLKPDGRLVLPLALRGAQLSVAFAPQDDYLTSLSIASCGFTYLRGASAAPRGMAALAPHSGLYLWVADQSLIDGDAVYRQLTGRSREVVTDLAVTAKALDEGFGLWLELARPDRCLLLGEGSDATRAIVPSLLQYAAGQRVALGLISEDGLAFLTGPPGESPRSPEALDAAPFPLSIRTFGVADGLREELLGQLKAWDAAGRPTREGMRLRAYPAGRVVPEGPTTFTIAKQWTQLVVDWPSE
jgi:protein-L-isoaspartate(D-aspartate) O-methyltransferase